MKLIRLTTILIICIFIFSGCSRLKDPKKEVQKDYQLFMSSVIDKNWTQAWDCLSYESQKQYDDFVFKPFKSTLAHIPQSQKQTKIPQTEFTISQIESMSPPDFFAFQMSDKKSADGMLKMLAPQRTVESTEITENSAVLNMSGDNKIHMRLENGKWRVVLFPPGTLGGK